MNSPRKSPTSNKSTTIKTKEDLAKLHCVLNLFRENTGEDPYLVRHLKEAIDASLVEETGSSESIDEFAAAAVRLAQEQPGIDASYGLFHLDLRGRGFDPLFIREELLGGLRKIAGYRRGLVVITGLRDAIIGPAGGYLTARRRESLDLATQYIDDLAAQWTTEETELNLLYV